MDWLKDPKNQKIVVPALIAVIVGGMIFAYFMYFRGPSAPSADQAAQTQQQFDPVTGQPISSGSAPAPQPDAGQPAPAPSPTPDATGAPATGAAPSAPVAAAPAAAPVQVAKVTPMQTWRSDPFQPIGYKAPRKGQSKIKPPIMDFPFTKLPGISVVRTVKREEPEIQQPSRRMAGILLNDRVYAIIESGGTSQVVQPGDYLLDRLASVERIEPGKVILKTVDKKPKYITVRMAASQHVTAPPTTSNTGAPPPPGGGAPIPIRRPSGSSGGVEAPP